MHDCFDSNEDTKREYVLIIYEILVIYFCISLFVTICKIRLLDSGEVAVIFPMAS
ncbi:hypothetical protein X777_01748 [Ooceraea biroi]|uniref:Uncharacterized protein n=1 Tax=Ooceraea biroi TaxID=2015173 RepID=A0A026WM62_OOCBI|nr:hypothetical protein X777_01748 [Ooceraea biroi]